MRLPWEELEVYISYAAPEDSQLVDRIADVLDRLHLRAFTHERYGNDSRNDFELTKTMIRWCPYFLAVLTRDSIGSEKVNQEMGYAAGVWKEIIPIVEVDDDTGERFEPRGFIELHNPIDYRRNDEFSLITQVIHAFYALLSQKGEWKDSIELSCQCGNEFDVHLQYAKRWETWLADPDRKPFEIMCLCENCRRQIAISFPDCRILPQNP